MVVQCVYLLNGLSAIVIAFICFYTCIAGSAKKKECRLGKLIGINGIVYLVPAFINLAWAFELLFPIKKDFILIEGVLNIIKTVLLLIIIYRILGSKKIVYFMFLFMLSIVGVIYSVDLFFTFISAISYLLILIASMDLIIISDKHLKKVGYALLAYAIVSGILLFSIFKGVNIMQIPWFVANSILVIVFVLLYFDMMDCGLDVVSMPKKRKTNIFFLGLKFIIFIMAMNLFLLLSTISIHELGHALSAQYYGCERSKAVIYDMQDYPHTEIVCKSYYNNTVITLAGIVLTVAVGMVFLITGNRTNRYIAFLIFGFSGLIGYGDLTDIHVSMNMIWTIIFVSIIFVLIGIVNLALYFIEQHRINYNKKEDEEFLIDDDHSITDIYGLLRAIRKMGTMSFKNFIQDRGKELYKWLNEGIKEKGFAEEFIKAEDKKEAEVVILVKLLKEKDPSIIIKKNRKKL